MQLGENLGCSERGKTYARRHEQQASGTLHLEQPIKPTTDQQTGNEHGERVGSLAPPKLRRRTDERSALAGASVCVT